MVEISTPPGVRFIDTPQTPTIEGVAVDVAGFVGLARWGPDDEERLLTSFDDFRRIYGDLRVGDYGGFATGAFFQEGGQFLHFSRVVGSGAAKATGATKAAAGDADTIDASGRYFGEFGNQLTVATNKVTTEVAVITAAIDTDVAVVSVRGFQVGDVVDIDDGTNRTTAWVVRIDTAARKLELDVAVGFVFAVGTAVGTATTHRMISDLAVAFTPPGDASSGTFTVTDASGIGIGDIIFIYTGASTASQLLVEMKVTNVNGTLITATQLNNQTAVLTELPIGAFVTSINFDVTVQRNGEVVETHRSLTLEIEDIDGFVDDRLSGVDNPSNFVEVVDASNAEVLDFRSFAYPHFTAAPLSGGLDGSAPLDTDFLGTNTGKAFTHGVRLFDTVADIRILAVPGITTLGVVKGFTDYADEFEEKLHYLMDAPLEDDTLDELNDFRLTELGRFTRKACLYAPWNKETNPLDPAAALLDLPPSGRAAGVWADVARRRGIEKSPANEAVTVDGLTAQFTDPEHAFLNDIGVNLTRDLPGRGILIFGARTLHPREDGRHFISVSRIEDFVKLSVKGSATQFNFDPITPALFAQIEGSVTRFLLNLWLKGALFGQTAKEAFSVTVNASTNPKDVTISGKVRGLITIFPTPPAEKIEFGFNLFSTGGEFFEV